MCVPDCSFMIKAGVWMKKRIYPFFINLFSVLTICFFSSMEVYAANYNDFSLPFSQTWWIILLFSLAAAVLISVPGLFLKDKPLFIINTLVFSLGICAYVQEIFLNNHLVLLDGREVIFSPMLKITNALLWILIIGSILFISFFMKKKGKKDQFLSGLVFISCAMLVIQGTGLFSSVSAMPDADYENAGYLSSEGEFTLSSGNNVVVFVVDSCSVACMEQALAEQPDLLKQMDGFTWYPDCTSVYSRTYPSLVYLFSGERCYYDVPFNEYLTTAYNNSGFLADIKSTGTDIRVFTDPIFFDGAAREQIDNFRTFSGKALDIIRPGVLIRQMLHISGYKCLPYFLKARFQYNVVILNHLVRKDPSDIAIEFEDYKFYTSFKENRLTVSEAYPSAFRLYHLWGPHPDCFIDENAEYLDGAEPVQALRGTFKIISEYIDEMKKQGIYDSSTIILLADHGDSYGSDDLEIDSPRSCLMMAKPAGGSGPIRVSQAPVSHDNYFSTVLSAFGIRDERFSAPEVYNIPEDCTEPRYYYFEAFFRDMPGSVASREYRIDGDARSIDSYTLTGEFRDVLYNQDAVSKIRLSEFLASKKQ